MVIIYIINIYSVIEMNFLETLKKIAEISKLYAQSGCISGECVDEKQKNHQEKLKKADEQVNQLLASYEDDQAKRYLKQIIQDIKKKRGIIAQDTPPIILYPDSDESRNYGEHYNRECYQFLMPYCQLAYLSEKTGNVQEHALKLSILFDQPEKALAYIRNNPQQNRLAIHDACLCVLPTDLNYKKWKKIIEKNIHDHSFRNLLGQAKEIEKLLEKQSKGKIIKPDRKKLKEKKDEINKKMHNSRY